MFSLGPGALEITDLEPLSSLLSPPSSNLQDLFQPPPHTEKQYGQETDWDKETEKWGPSPGLPASFGGSEALDELEVSRATLGRVQH